MIILSISVNYENALRRKEGMHMRKIFVADGTLKNIGKLNGHALLFREKKAIAECIDGFGADAIELAPVKKPAEDKVICRTIAESVEHSMLCIPAGSTVESVQTAWECIKNAKKACLQIEMPVSTVQMEYIYHLKADKMALKIEELVKAAAALCSEVEFIALDATRAEEDVLTALLKKAEEAGATAVTLTDEAGIYMPEEFAALAAKAKKSVSVPVYVQVSDALRLAVADALAALNAGADGVKTAVTGDSVLLTGEFAEAVRVKGDVLGLECSLEQTRIHRDIDTLLKQVSRVSEDMNAAQGTSDILLDGGSTLSDTASAAARLGYELSSVDVGHVYDSLQRVLEKKTSVEAKELEAIIASSAMQVPSTYHLDYFTTTTAHNATSVSYVRLKRNDEVLSGLGYGDGPIDSAFKAIEEAVGFHYELDDFEIQSVTEGKEALGSSLVRLRRDGRLYSGNGLSTDIVGASIRAYINALNKIVYEGK